MEILRRSARWRPSGAGLAWLPPAAIGGAIRFHHAWSMSGVWEPHLNRGEGYYEGAVNFIGYHVLADRVPSFLPSGTRGPLYQAFIVLVELFTSAPHPGHIVFAQAALSTLAIVAVYELGSELASPWAGFLAALWMALDFTQIELLGQLDLASFYQLAILALAVALVTWVKTPGPKRTLILALTLASTLICRSSHYAFPLLLVAACAALPRWKAARRALPLLGATVALLLGLMAAVGYLRFGRLAPMDAESGVLRFYATTVGEPCCVDGQLERYRAEAAGAKERAAAADAAVMRRGFLNIRERPLLFASAFLRNAAEFWRPYWPALGLGLFAALAHGSDPGFQALLAALLSLIGYHVLVVYPWHSSVALPLLAVLAGIGLGSTRRIAGERRFQADFFRRPRDAGYARAALVSVYAGLFAVVLLIFAAERLSYRTARIARSLADPSSVVHRAPLALLDLSVDRSRGRYGLEERADTLAAMGLYSRACADLKRLARLTPSSAEFTRRAGSCAADAALSEEGLRRIKARVLSDPALRGLTADLRLSSPCDWPGWSAAEPDGLGYLDRCVLASPRDAHRRQNRGVQRYLSGDLRAAEEDFRAAVKANPAHIPAYISLSTALFESGRPREALPHIDRAVILAGRGPDLGIYAAALESRASVRAALGRSAGAESDLARAREIRKKPL